MTRAAASFAAISAAEADIARVTGDLRRRVAEIDAELAAVVPGMAVDDAERCQSARNRRDEAVGDLCAVLEQLATALASARVAGQPAAFAPPSWS